MLKVTAAGTFEGPLCERLELLGGKRTDNDLSGMFTIAAGIVNASGLTTWRYLIVRPICEKPVEYATGRVNAVTGSWEMAVGVVNVRT